MSNLAQRIITGLLGAGIMIAGIVFSEWLFAFIFLALTVLTLNEFYSLASKNGYHPFSVWGLFFSIVLFALGYLSISGLVGHQFLWLLFPLFTLGFILPLYSKKAHPINCLAVSLMGVVYIAIPFTLLSVIAFKSGTYGFELVLGLILAQWASDTGAYFVGKAIGKTKLFQRVSPNKTWEGTIGGLVFALAVMYVWSIYFQELQTLEWLGLGLIVAGFGSFGDLVESLFKRTLAIKDSGKILRGHGGFLDRFDGLIIAIPFATAYLMLLG